MTYLLGEDGKVHCGEVIRKMSGVLMEIDCGVTALRMLSRGEVWWRADERRICPRCFKECGDDGG